jgi:hypothetical protein
MAATVSGAESMALFSRFRRDPAAVKILKNHSLTRNGGL